MISSKEIDEVILKYSGIWNEIVSLYSFNTENNGFSSFSRVQGKGHKILFATCSKHLSGWFIKSTLICSLSASTLFVLPRSKFLPCEKR